MKIELLLGRSCESFWEICGATYSDAGSFGEDFIVLRASKLAIEKAKEALQSGKRVLVSKHHEFIEIIPTDLVVEELDELTARKRIALNDVNAAMHQNILGLCVIDALDYMSSFMDLLASGIFINNSNREDKYFEVIEAAQTNLEPDPLNDEATVEEEQTWVEAKRQHQIAQDNLMKLEKYLNSLDKIQKIDCVHKILQEAKANIEKAESEEAVEEVVQKYKEQVDSHFYTPFGALSLVPKTASAGT